MSKSKIIVSVFVLLLVSAVFCGCFAYAEGGSEAAIVEDIPTVQAFSDEAVSEEDMNAIVNAGVNAPSAMNSQPWHFSVVTSREVMDKINSGMSFGGPAGKTPPTDMKKPEGMPEMPDGMPEMPDGMPEGAPSALATLGSKAGIADAPMIIVVSCKAGSELDAGLAAQNMSVEGQLLGYGTKIISSPTIALNGEKQAEYKELLGIPEDMSAVCVILIGKANTSVDSVSGATARNPIDDVVSFVK